MPLYEYECDTCHHRFEVIQRYADALIATCPKCGGPVQKLMSSPAIQFKGSGFYITDYARKNSPDAGKPDAGKSEGGKSEGGKPEGGKSESASKTSDAKPAEAPKSSSTESAASSPPPASSSSRES
jgi:putative FmdB family regulatory protein